MLDDVEDANDVRMVDGGREARFFAQLVARGLVTFEERVQLLDGEKPSVLAVRKMDAGHPARPQRTDDLEAPHVPPSSLFSYDPTRGSDRRTPQPGCPGDFDGARKTDAVSRTNFEGGWNRVKIGG